MRWRHFLTGTALLLLGMKTAGNRMIRKENAENPPVGSFVTANGLRLHRAIPHSRLILLEKTGHMVHHKRPDVVVDAVREVMQS